MNTKYYDLIFLILIILVNILTFIFYFIYSPNKKNQNNNPNPNIRPSVFTPSPEITNFTFTPRLTSLGDGYLDDTDDGSINLNGTISLSDNSFYVYDMDHPRRGDDVSTTWGINGTPVPGKFYLLNGASTDTYLRSGAIYKNTINSNNSDISVFNNQSEMDLEEVYFNVHHVSQLFYTPDDKLYIGYYNQLVTTKQ